MTSDLSIATISITATGGNGFREVLDLYIA